MRKADARALGVVGELELAATTSEVEVVVTSSACGTDWAPPVEQFMPQYRRAAGLH
jgi:hypothetical protein